MTRRELRLLVRRQVVAHLYAMAEANVDELLAMHEITDDEFDAAEDEVRRIAERIARTIPTEDPHA